MPMRVVVLLSTAALAVAAGAHATPLRGTLTGTVSRGPITPVCAAEQPCSGPAAGVTLLFLRNGAVAGRVVTDASGRYALRLRAGTYAVRRANGGRKLDPDSAAVRPGRISRVDFFIDTGIR
jgi:hypothetical protein